MSRITTFTETRNIASIIAEITKGNLQNLIPLLDYHGCNKVLDSMGNTPLHYAIMCKQNNIIEFLLDEGADDKIKNIVGEDCRTLACRYLIVDFFDFKMKEISNLKKINSIKAEQINKLENSLTHWRKSYDKLTKKTISLEDEIVTLKRKNDFLEESYTELAKRHRKK